MGIGPNLAYHVIRRRHGTGLEQGRLLSRGAGIAIAADGAAAAKRGMPRGRAAHSTERMARGFCLGNVFKTGDKFLPHRGAADFGGGRG
jgi:hypothetical protein